MRVQLTSGTVRRYAPKAALLAGVAIATAALAQGDYSFSSDGAPLRLKSDYYGYAATISPRVGYSDNINLEPSGSKDGSAYFSTALSGSAIYSTKRLTAIAAGNVDLSYITEGSDFAVNQDVGLAGTFTVADNLAYVDFSGSTARQLFGDNARFSQNINSARSQRANVHTLSASPYLYHKFEDQSSATLRYRFTETFIDDSNAGANPFGGNFLNDSRSQEVVAGLNSGSKWERLRISVSGYGNKTVEDNSDVLPRTEFKQGSGIVEAQLGLTPRFGLSGAAGYDDINTDSATSFFNDETLSGFFWRAGFYARPGRRTDIRLEYGERFGNGFIDGALSYRLSNRFVLSAGAGQSFESRAQFLNSNFVESQRSVLEFADALRQGGELSPAGAISQATRFGAGSYYSQSSGFGINEFVYADLRGAFERTEFQLNANYSNTDFGFRVTRYATASLDVRRELSRRLAAYGGVFVRNAQTTFDPVVCQTAPFLFGFDVTAPLFDPVAACVQYALNNGETWTYGGRIGGSFRIYKNLSAFAEFAHTQRSAADNALLEYGENAFLGGVTLSF